VLFEEDKEMLEDLIAAAMNDAVHTPSRNCAVFAPASVGIYHCCAVYDGNPRQCFRHTPGHGLQGKVLRAVGTPLPFGWLGLEHLGIDQLERRLEMSDLREVILATGSTVEGDDRTVYRGDRPGTGNSR